MKTFTKLIYNLILVLPILLFNVQVTGSDRTKPNEPGPWPSVQVNTYTGNLFHQRTDLQMPARGELDLGIFFSFNSLKNQLDEGYGNGWSFNYGMRYNLDGNSFTIGLADGGETRFIWTGTTWFPGPDEFGTLSEYDPGKYLYTTKHGIMFYFDDAAHKKLTKIEDRNGNTFTLSYTGVFPTMITDPSGRMLNLTWSGGHLAQINDPNTIPARSVSYSYDVDWNLIQVIRPLGNEYQYDYDPAGNMIMITDPNGNEITISYNSNEAVSALACPVVSYNKTFAYDNCTHTTTVSQVVSMITRQTVYAFDMYGRVVNLQHPDGNAISYTWDSQNTLLSITDEGGDTTTFTRDSKGNKISTTDCVGNSEYFAYEPNFNKISSHTNKRGYTTTYSYDLSGNLTGIADCLGSDEPSTYNGSGNMISKTDKTGFTTTFSYDTDGNLAGLTDPLGNSESMGYDGVGNMLSRTDKRGYTTLYNYNLLDRNTSVTDWSGFSKTYTYDANGNLTGETNENGFTTTYTYDALNRMISSMDALAGVTSYTYDEAGNILIEINTRGCATSHTYNLRDWPTSTTDPLGSTELHTYDASGNRLSFTDKSGNTTTYSYDCLGQMLLLTDPSGFTESYSYDANGNKVSNTDKNANVTTYAYDCLDRLVTRNFPLAFVELYAYDAVGRRTSFTDRNNHVTIYTYDALGRLTSETDPLLLILSYTYDAAGNRTGSTDKNGNTTTYAYDALNRRISSTDPLGNTETYGYDPAGNRTSFTDKRGFTIMYVYDALNRYTSSTSPMGYTESYIYDAMNNQTSITDKNGYTTNYTYDCNNQMISLTDPLGFSEISSYSPTGNLTAATDKNVNTTSFGYSCCRLTSKTDPLFFTETYAYDPAGNRTGITDREANMTTYAYDNLGRLVSVTTPMLNSTLYTYDGVGNTLTRRDANLDLTTYTFNFRNELVTTTYPDATGISYTYDNNGNLTQTVQTGGAGETVTYTYNANNWLLSKLTNYGAFSKLITYTYDQNGNCSSLTNETGTISYLYDIDNRLIQIIDQNLLITTFFYDGIGNQLAVNYPNGVSTISVYDATGRVILVVTADTPAPASTPPPAKKGEIIKSNQILANIDCAVVQIHSPVTGPWLSEAEPVTIEAVNFGMIPAFGVMVSYSLDGNPPVIENIPQPLFPNTPVLFTFAQPADMSIPGHTYQLLACTMVPGDEVPSNNCMMALITNTSSSDYQSFDYQYDGMGNKIQEIRNSGASVVNMAYSTRNELLFESFMPSGDFNQYTYTPAERRASLNENGILSAYAYNNDGALVSAGTVGYVVDNNGNRITKNDYLGATQYTYGYENELLNVTFPDLSSISYAYSASRQQIKHIDGGGDLHYYLNDGDALLVEYDALGIVNSYFNPGISIDQGLSRGYYHYNGFGSTTLQTDPLKIILASNEFDAFGNIMNPTGNWINNDLKFENWKYFDELISFGDSELHFFDPETGIGHLARGYVPRKETVVTDPEGTTQETEKNGKKTEDKKKVKCCGVKTFVVKWSKPSGLYVGQMATIDTEIEFLNDDEHDPACCLFCQNVETVAEIIDGPGKGWKVDTSPMHDDNYSRGDDSDGKPELPDPGFTTDDNPGISGLDPKDDINYSFTAEQIVKEGCDPPCPKGAVVAKRGPHTVTVKGKEPRVWTGVPETLDK